MRDSAGKEDLKKIHAELTQLARDMRAAFQRTAPVFKTSLEQMRMAAQNARMGLKAFGEEMRKALENWAEEEGDGDGKVGAKK